MIDAILTITNVMPTGGGINVTLNDGITDYLMRVDQETGITEEFINGLASNNLRVTGLGGQFDTSSPYDDGYQILPRYESDLETIIATTEPAWGAATSIFPNPASDYFVIQTEVEVEHLVVRNQLGQLMLQMNNPNASVRLDELADGLYIIELHHAGERIVRKLLKQ
jgi:hypothetical protein